MRILYLLFALLHTLAIHAQEFDKSETLITIKDTIRLATDVFKPKGEGPWPVILIRTPYNKDQLQGDAAFFAAKGYVVVTQDVRGKYKSSGQFIPFIHEVEDGIATLDWIAAQSWSNKSVGIYGSSYAGFCGLSLSDGKHPILKTVFNNAGWLSNEKVIEEGGAINLLLGIPWTYTFTNTKTMRRPNIKFDSLFRILPVQDMLNNYGFANWWQNFDTLLDVNKSFRYDRVRIPILHMTGWFDFTMRGTMDFYERVNKNKRAQQRVVIGPWSHGQNYFPDSTKVGIEDFGAAARFGGKQLQEKAAQWFDENLKNVKPVSRGIDVFVLFLNQWITMPSLINAKQIQQLYFTSGAGANSRKGDGRLLLRKAAVEGIDTFTYHPLQPVPTNGGANFHFFPHLLGVRNQAKLQERKDVLVYLGSPADSNMMVVGRPMVDLYVSSSAQSTDFTVKLFIADSSGSRKLVTDAIQRLTSKQLKGGRIHHMQLDLGPIAFYIRKSEQVGVEISSSNFPKYDRNLNTGDKSVTGIQWQTAHQKIYHGKRYPSGVRLPIW